MKLLTILRPSARRSRLARGGAFLLLVALTPAGWWLATRPPTLRLRTSWETPFRSRGTVCLAYSPDGKTLAVGGRDKTIRLYESETGRPLARLDTKEWADYPLFHPDGRTLLVGSVIRGRKAGKYTSTSRLLRFRIDDGRLMAEAVLPPNAYIHDLALTPDGKTAVVAWNRDWVERWQRYDVTTLQERGTAHRLENVMWAGRPGSLSRDGALLAIVPREGRPWDEGRPLEVRGLAGTPAPRTISGPFLSPSKWSPDATQLAVLLSAGGDSTGAMRLALCEPATGRTRVLSNGGFSGPVAFSPDGRLLVALRDVSEPILETRSVGQIARDVGAGRFVRQAGTYEYSEVLVFDVASGRLRARFGDHEQGIEHFAISPDGKTLATVGLDGLVRLWVMPE